MVVSEIDVNLEGIEEAVAKLEQLNQKANEIRVSVSRITGEIKELNKQDISPSSGKEFELQLATRGALNRERESYRSELSKITGRESRIRAQLREAYKIAEHYGIDELTSAIPYEKIQKRTGGNRRSPIDVGNELTKTILNKHDIKSEEIKKEDVTETTSITDSIINTENNITTSADQQKPKSKGRKKRAAKSSGGGEEISDDPDEPKPEKKKRSLTDRITNRGRDPKSKEHASGSAPDAKEDKGLIYRLFGLFPKKQDTELQGDFNKSLEDTAKDQENVGRKTRDSTKKQRENNRSLKWTLGLLVMLHNVFRKFTSGTKVISQVLSMFSSGLGFLLDMIILPLLPLLIEMVMTIYGIGKAVKSFNDDLTDIHPVLGYLASIIELIMFAGFGLWLLNTARKIALLAMGAEAATGLLGTSGLLGAIGALTALELLTIGIIVALTIGGIYYLGKYWSDISQCLKDLVKDPLELTFGINWEDTMRSIFNIPGDIVKAFQPDPYAAVRNAPGYDYEERDDSYIWRDLQADFIGWIAGLMSGDTERGKWAAGFLKREVDVAPVFFENYTGGDFAYNDDFINRTKGLDTSAPDLTPLISGDTITNNNTTTSSTNTTVNNYTFTGDNYFEDESDLKNFFENILSRQQ